MSDRRGIVALLYVAPAAFGALGCNGDECSGGCRSGRECVGGNCLLPCTDVAACGADTVCFQGYCEFGILRDPNGDAAGGDASSGDGRPPPICGNNVADPGEACDGSDLGSVADCADAGYGPAGTVGCLVTCAALDLTGCTEPPSSCGNNTINGSEQCDGTSLGIDTCLTLGYTGGTLACNANCSFDVGACTGP